MRKRRNQRGTELLEFTLVGIPLMFILLSTCEMARGMWNYHTMAYAIKEGARYVVVRGKGCSINGNSCNVTVGTIANQIAGMAIGLDPNTLNVTLSSASGTVSCQPLSSCFTNSMVWPPVADSAPGSDITVAGQYLFKSALAMFWPGDGVLPVGTIGFPASTRQPMQF